jgi:hypothetical protein
LNLFTKQLNYFVDELGKSVVGSVDTMVRFVGWSDEGESDIDAVVVFALLVDARFSPKMQYFVKCGLRDDPGCVGLLNKTLPFVVRILTRAPRFLGNAGVRVIDVSTSDEFCWMLLQQRRVWKFGAVTQHICCDCPTLLDTVVIGYEAFFKERIVAAKAKPCKRAFVLPVELDIDDPWAYGQSRAVIPSSIAECVPVADIGLFGLDGEDGGDLLLNPDDLLHNELEVGACNWIDAAVQDVDPEEQADQLDPMCFASSDPNLDDHDEVTESLHELEQSCSADIEKVPDIFDVVRVACIDDLGYVRCAVHPWSSKNPAGRLTSWPNDKPMALRSVSMRCFYHPNCSLAKSRKKLTDEDLLCWLFSGDALVLGGDTLRAQGERHVQLGRSDRFLKLSSQPSSSSGSGSVCPAPVSVDQ